MRMMTFDEKVEDYLRENALTEQSDSEIDSKGVQFGATVFLSLPCDFPRAYGTRAIRCHAMWQFLEGKQQLGRFQWT